MCKTWRQAPSQRLQWPPLRNDWAAYQFDATVMYVGLVLENAAQEHEEYGPHHARQSRRKYTLDELLDPNFRLPPPGTEQGGLKEMALAAPGTVGRWKQKPKAV